MSSGVYIIKNSVTGKVYVGSATNLQARGSTHFSRLNRGVHHSAKLQASFNKHGAAAFEFKVLVHCPPEELLVVEQLAIDAHRSATRGYNIRKVASSNRGLKHTPEARAKISEAGRRRKKLTTEARASIGAAQRARVRTEGERRKMSASSMGQVVSTETRDKISVGLRRYAANHKGRKGPAHPPGVREKISAGMRRVWAERNQLQQQEG